MFEWTSAESGNAERFEAEVGSTIQHGKICIIVSVGANSLLPYSVHKCADQLIILLQLDEFWLVDFLEKITGEKSDIQLSSIAPALITPAVLRLAARERQTADEYAARIALAIEPTRAIIAVCKIRLEDIHGMKSVVNWGQLLAKDLDAYRAGHFINTAYSIPQVWKGRHS